MSVTRGVGDRTDLCLLVPPFAARLRRHGNPRRLGHHRPVQPAVTRHETNGIGAVTPFPAYRALYPPAIDTADIAYHFDGDYSTPLPGDAELLTRIGGAITDWRAASARPSPPVLQLFEREGSAVVLDTRPAPWRCDR